MEVNMIGVGGIAAVANPMAFLGAGLETAGEIYNTHQTNKANKQIAEQANAMSQANAREQMAFQERMSNSAYQRAMEDMKKSGLNPILAYSQGGASTPSGSAGSVTAAKMEKADLSSLGKFTDFAVNPPSMQREQNAANLTRTHMEGEKLASDQVVNSANTALLREQASKARAETDYIEIRKLNDAFDRELKNAQTDLARAQKTGKDVETARARVKQITEQKQARVDRFRADRQAEFDEKWRNIELGNKLLRDTLGTANEAANLVAPGRGFKKAAEAFKTRSNNSAKQIEDKHAPEYNNGYHRKYRELELDDNYRP